MYSSHLRQGCTTVCCLLFVRTWRKRARAGLLTIANYSSFCRKPRHYQPLWGRYYRHAAFLWRCLLLFFVLFCAILSLLSPLNHRPLSRFRFAHNSAIACSDGETSTVTQQLCVPSCVPLEYHHHEFWDQNNNMGNSINKVIITVRNSLAQSQIESPTNIFKIPQYFTGGIRLLFINTSTKCRPLVRVPQATWGGEQQERRRMSLHNQNTINLHSYRVTG